MSKRIQLPASMEELSRQVVAFPMQDPAEAGGLETLAQLVEQIDDALLVVENPRLAARVYAALRSIKAA
jgi:hypothetical protein